LKARTRAPAWPATLKSLKIIPRTTAPTTGANTLARGDWQIAGWLLRIVPDESADHVANPISLISWWKIFDNLRRSLVEPAAFVLLVAGWFTSTGQPWHWTVAAICTFFIPAWVQLVFDLVRRP